MLSYMPIHAPQINDLPRQTKAEGVGIIARKFEKEKDKRESIALSPRIPRNETPLVVEIPLGDTPAFLGRPTAPQPAPISGNPAEIINNFESKDPTEVDGHAPSTPTKRTAPRLVSPNSPYHLLYPTTPEFRSLELKGQVENDDSPPEQDPSASIATWAPFTTDISSAKQPLPGSHNQKSPGELTEFHKAELAAIWAADPHKRLPTLPSRYVWANERGVLPKLVQRWFHRRRWRLKVKSDEQYDIMQVQVVQVDGVFSVTFPPEMLKGEGASPPLRIKIKVPPHMRSKPTRSNRTKKASPPLQTPTTEPDDPFLDEGVPGSPGTIFSSNPSPITCDTTYGSDDVVTPISECHKTYHLPSLQSIRNITKITPWPPSKMPVHQQARVPTPPWR